MTSAQLRKIRLSLGLSQRKLGEALGLKSDDPGRQVRRWEAGDAEISGPVALAMRYLELERMYAVKLPR